MSGLSKSMDLVALSGRLLVSGHPSVRDQHYQNGCDVTRFKSCADPSAEIPVVSYVESTCGAPTKRNPAFREGHDLYEVYERPWRSAPVLATQSVEIATRSPTLGGPGGVCGFQLPDAGPLWGDPAEFAVSNSLVRNCIPF